GVNGVTVIAIAGTNAAASARSGADASFALACIGTNVGTTALNTANNAIGGLNGVTVMAQAGTNAAASAKSGADSANLIAIAGTTLAQSAFTLAQNGSSLASEALAIA